MYVFIYENFVKPEFFHRFLLTNLGELNLRKLNIGDGEWMFNNWFNWVVRLDEEVGSVHRGYCILRQWRNKEITSEAFSAVIKFLVEEVDLKL